MTGSHVVKVVAGKKKRVYSVVAVRELTEKDTVCSECGNPAPEVKLTLDRIFSSKGEVSQLGVSLLRPILGKALEGHVYASSVCGHPKCWDAFSAKLTRRTIKDLAQLSRTAA